MMTWFESMREAWEKLSDRERRMLSIMGGVFVAMVAFVTVWATSSALAEVEEERDAIRSVLSDIERAGDLLAKREAERKVIEARFRTKAPALAAYVEGKAKEEGLEVRQVVEEPEKVTGGYRRHSIRVSFSGVSLRPLMHLLASIDDERLALAVERLQIEHYSAGDSYKVDVGIASYEPVNKAGSDKAGTKQAAEPAR
jgi:general secretion pathway protein M